MAGGRELTPIESFQTGASGIRGLTGAVSNIGGLVGARKDRDLRRETLAEQQRQFDKQFGLDQFLGMVSARDQLNKQEWQRQFRNALMGR